MMVAPAPTTYACCSREPELKHCSFLDEVSLTKGISGIVDDVAAPGLQVRRGDHFHHGKGQAA